MREILKPGRITVGVFRCVRVSTMSMMSFPAGTTVMRLKLYSTMAVQANRDVFLVPNYPITDPATELVTFFMESTTAMSSDKKQSSSETATFTVKAGLAQMLKGAWGSGSAHARSRPRESSE